MSSIYGRNIEVSIFGESHGKAIGVTIAGLPAGIEIDMDELEAFLKRRAPGRNEYSTPRKEDDSPEFISGVIDSVTCGSPITAIITNGNRKSGDYRDMANMPRPGHADYAAHVKYGGHEDYRGGGHFSGRLTAPLCIAGGIFLQILKKRGISVAASILEIGGNREDPMSEILKAKKLGDSVGGVVECEISGMPAGIGSPMFDGLENKISQAVFGIPAVKGIEFGLGFEAARVFGSENNDDFYYEEDPTPGLRSGGVQTHVRTRTNNHGGILGGISSGMPIIFRVAFKPTPSIARKQNTILYDEEKNVEIEIKGRHDPCIVPRALACVEAAAAMAVMDAMRE